MRISKWMWVAALAAWAITMQGYAQGNPKHHVYKIEEIGTFGGPDSGDISGPGNVNLNYLNSQGTAVGAAATSTPDSLAPNCVFYIACYVGDALTFQNGKLTDLGALPGANNSSWATGLNDIGLVVGLSETGGIDPQTGYPEYHAVVWNKGRIKDLGTLGGSVSLANSVNDQGMVVGVATNDIPDPYTNGLGPYDLFYTITTQQRAFLWQGGQMKDLGTLGGNDAAAAFVNQFGQVAGESYTNTTPNATTGLPTQDPFLWENGTMIDLGTLGGTYGTVFCLNNRGQVVGQSNVAGDQYPHPFLWDHGVMTDLGNLDAGEVITPAVANWINDAGEVVGGSYVVTPVYSFHGFLWRHGTMIDLGSLSPNGLSNALGINVWGQVVGLSYAGTGSYDSAFLWENGAMADLNTLVAPPSDGLHLVSAINIADNGDIYAVGVLPNGETRIAVLTPAGLCEGDCEARIAASESTRASAVQTGQFGKTPIGKGQASGKLPLLQSHQPGQRIFWPAQPASSN